MTCIPDVIKKIRHSLSAMALSALVVTGLLSACAAPPQQSSDQAFPTAMANQVFNVGYEKISDRYLEQVTVEDIAVQGLSGLVSIDPSFRTTIQDNNLVVESKDFGPFSYAMPENFDADGWAELTVSVLLAARTYSAAFLNADAEELYEAVFDGSLSLLDSFSRYSGASQAAENRAKRSGFGGIGIRYAKTDAGALITAVFKNSPAATVGLLKGDVIVQVDQQSIIGLDRIAARKMMRGAIGTVVELQITRGGGRAFTRSIKRERILLPTVFASEKNGIIYIRVDRFNNRTTRNLASYVISTQKKLKGRSRGIIIDLRGNPGGLLTQAVNMADLFLKHGRILSTRGRHPKSRHDYNAKSNDITNGLPIAVLMNGRSASAAEIVAAALQDHDRAIVIGTSSFGKGTVQSVIPLPNGGELTLTWSRFITPSGYVLHGLGVPPYICTANRTTRGIGVDEILNKVVNGSTRISDTLERWHFISHTDDIGREQLRTECPTSKARPKVDMEIARRILNDQSMYRRILSLTTPSTAAGG